MAMVVSAIANDGTLMQPRLTTKVVNQDGQIVETIPPQEYDQVMKPKIAGELQAMMRDVVEEGTGRRRTSRVNDRRQDRNRLDRPARAGRRSRSTTPGSSALPRSRPEDRGRGRADRTFPNGYGGSYAAPIAAQVIKTLLAEGQ